MPGSVRTTRIHQSEFVFRTFAWFRFGLNPSGICLRKSGIAGERSAEISAHRQLYTRISGDTPLRAEVPNTLAATIGLLRFIGATKIAEAIRRNASRVGELLTTLGILKQ